MAVLCAKCGAEVPAGSHFCAACGTPVLAAAASAPQAGPAYTPVNVPSQPTAGAQAATGSQPLPGYTPVGGVPPAGYAPAGSYPQPPAAPVKSGGSALKIILIIFAVLVGLGILGAGAVGFTVWRVARAFHVNGKNGQVTLNTPSGSVTASNASNFTADELGTDIYPGAQPTTGGMRMNLPTGSVVSGVLRNDGFERAGSGFLQEQARERSFSFRCGQQRHDLGEKALARQHYDFGFIPGIGERRQDEDIHCSYEEQPAFVGHNLLELHRMGA
jgi:hypothetical protein